MFQFNLLVVFATLGVSIATPVYNDSNVGDSCTITSFSQVSNVIKSCTNIVVQKLSVPAGKTLELELKSGTHLTFKGVTTFNSGKHWEGPLMFIRGSKLTVVGATGSVLDGKGEDYWDGTGDKGGKKPKFFKIRTTGSTFSKINLLNCPHQCVSIDHSENLIIDQWNIDASAGDKGQLGHNTDGFDISNSDTVTIKNSNVKNQDDCVAVNSGKNLHFTNLHCSGGHGLSLSIGVDIADSSKNYAQNITFNNCVIENSRNGIHIKTHTDAAPGYINDIGFSNIKMSGITHYGVNVQQDYKGGKSTGKPANNIPIKGMRLNGVTGTMTGSHSMPVYILCASGGCSNFHWDGVSIGGNQKDSTCNYEPSGYKC